MKTSPHLQRLEELTPKIIDIHSVMLNLFKYTSDLIAIGNEEGKFAMVSDRWTDVLGYTKKELMGMVWADLIHPDDIAMTMDAFDKMQKDDKLMVDSFTNRYRKKDGTYVELCWNATPFINGYCYGIARYSPLKS
jgi:PAS domain S-box-containing protein